MSAILLYPEVYLSLQSSDLKRKVCGECQCIITLWPCVILCIQRQRPFHPVSATAIYPKRNIAFIEESFCSSTAVANWMHAELPTSEINGNLEILILWLVAVIWMCIFELHEVLICILCLKSFYFHCVTVSV